MKLAIMQPYLFPYLGYFQLIRSADTFIILDDAQYIQQGWINRNQFLLKDRPHRFTFSIRNDGHQLAINERFFSDDFPKEKRKFLTMLHYAYAKAPQYADVFPLLEKIMACPETNVAAFIAVSIQELTTYMECHPPFYFSSRLDPHPTLKKQDRVLHLAGLMGADHYINPPGGTELYSRDIFAEHNIQLSFIRTQPLSYRQFGAAFVPNLSIIDVLMFNERSRVQQLLTLYEFF